MKKINTVLMLILSLFLSSCNGTTVDEENHTHNYNLEVTTSVNLASKATCLHPAKYYYACSCGALSTNTFEYGEKDSSNHKKSASWVTTETTHKKTYECCGEVVVAESEHTGGVSTCSSYAHCTVCGKEYGELGEHSYKQVVKEEYLRSKASCTDPATYFYSCSCGEKSPNSFSYGNVDLENHTGSLTYVSIDASNHKGTYTCCGEEVEENHSFSNDKCSLCNYEKESSGTGEAGGNTGESGGSTGESGETGDNTGETTETTYTKLTEDEWKAYCDKFVLGDKLDHIKVVMDSTTQEYNNNNSTSEMELVSESKNSTTVITDYTSNTDNIIYECSSDPTNYEEEISYYLYNEENKEEEQLIEYTKNIGLPYIKNKYKLEDQYSTLTNMYLDKLGLNAFLGLPYSSFTFNDKDNSYTYTLTYEEDYKYTTTITIYFENNELSKIINKDEMEQDDEGTGIKTKYISSLISNYELNTLEKVSLPNLDKETKELDSNDITKVEEYLENPSFIAYSKIEYLEELSVVNKDSYGFSLVKEDIYKGSYEIDTHNSVVHHLGSETIKEEDNNNENGYKTTTDEYEEYIYAIEDKAYKIDVNSKEVTQNNNIFEDIDSYILELTMLKDLKGITSLKKKLTYNYLYNAYILIKDSTYYTIAFDEDNFIKSLEVYHYFTDSSDTTYYYHSSYEYSYSEDGTVTIPDDLLNN